MKTFSWPLRHVRLEMTGAQGWVWYAWSMETETTMMGPAFKRTSDGYVRQERNRILKRNEPTKPGLSRAANAARQVP